MTEISNLIRATKATLPIMPVSLPKDLGVYQIYQAEYPESPFIPLPRGVYYRDWETDRKSTRLNSSHSAKSRMPSSA